MKTAAIIEGLTILERHRCKPNGFDVSAEHDQLYVSATDHAVECEDLERMVGLGWFQDDAIDDDGEFAIGNYDPLFAWSCFV